MAGEHESNKKCLNNDINLSKNILQFNFEPIERPHAKPDYTRILPLCTCGI